LPPTSPVSTTAPSTTRSRALLAKAHREAIGEGIALIGLAAAAGDQKAKRWLDGYGLPMRRRIAG
jgi:hypothetical protein